MKRIIAVALTFSSITFCYAWKSDRDKPVLLPSKFINRERFYLKMATISGDTILGYGDSGGGISLVTQGTIDKLHLQSDVKKGFAKHIMGIKYIAFQKLIRDDKIPPPVLITKVTLTRHFRKVSTPFFVVVGDKGEFKELAKIEQVIPFDVFLAQNFFMGNAWTFDYIKQQIWVNTPLYLSDTINNNVQKIGFKKDDNRVNLFGHPSMKIVVDGEIIEVLFDCGASILLSETGKKGLDTKENSIGGSFIAKSVFDNWRMKHPEWKYIEKADGNADIIEVPQVTISGHTIGPVLFAERPDEAWSKGMINTMDKVVKGAIGGSALKYLKVTIDYNSELIKFE